MSEWMTNVFQKPLDEQLAFLETHPGEFVEYVAGSVEVFTDTWGFPLNLETQTYKDYGREREIHLGAIVVTRLLTNNGMLYRTIANTGFDRMYLFISHLRDDLVTRMSRVHIAGCDLEDGLVRTACENLCLECPEDLWKFNLKEEQLYKEDTSRFAAALRDVAEGLKCAYPNGLKRVG